MTVGSYHSGWQSSSDFWTILSPEGNSFYKTMEANADYKGAETGIDNTNGFWGFIVFPDKTIWQLNWGQVSNGPFIKSKIEPWLNNTTTSEIKLDTSINGRVFQTEASLNLKWTSKEIDGGVTITLLKNNNPIETIASNVSNTGSYNWNIADNLESGNNYRVVISGTGRATVSDTTDQIGILKRFIDEEHLLFDQSGLSVQSVSSEEVDGEDGAATNVFDGNLNTIWHSEWSNTQVAHPHEIIISLDTAVGISGFAYSPRISGTNGIITDCKIFVSNDNVVWNEVADIVWDGDQSVKYASFAVNSLASYVKIESLADMNGGSFSSGAEINLYFDTTFMPTNKDFSSSAKNKHLINTINNGLVILNSVKDNVTIDVLSINGRRIMRLFSNRDERCIIDLKKHGLPKGHYILTMKVGGLHKEKVKVVIK